jgi:hypothetical protein
LLKHGGFKLKTSSCPLTVFSSQERDWLLVDGNLDLIISNGLPLNQSDSIEIHTKDESYYSLFQHPQSLIQEYHYIRFLPYVDHLDAVLIPTLNDNKE